MNIEKLFVKNNESIINTMKTVDDNGKRIALVVENRKLLGIVTDGDIRRYILSSGDLNKEVSNIMNVNPITIYKGQTKKAKGLFKKKLLTAVPVIDKYDNMVDVLFWEDIFTEDRKVQEKIDIPVVIMAGGKGTRLYPYTKILPKPLVPIGDTPIIERIMNRFYGKGCKNFYVTVNYKKNMIKAYFNELNPEYNIEYIEEHKPLGTCGSLYLLKEMITNTFIVSNCDILIDGDYSDMLSYHKENENAITVITSIKNHVIPYGVIELDDLERVNRLIEKPQYNMLVNTGMYIIEPEVLLDVPEGTFFHITELIDQYIKKGKKIGTYPISEKSWLDMGQFSEMEKMIQGLGING